MSRATACFTFDNLGEAAEVGDGRWLGAADSHAHPSITTGLPRLLDLLDRQGVRGSFFVEGWNGEHHPEVVRGLVERGHELGMHGWVHESWASLDETTERDLAARATDALTAAAGTRPVGFRAPGGVRTASTPAVLLDLGYDFDASFAETMQPVLLPGGLPSVPFTWSGVDGYHYLAPDPVPPASVRDRWLATLDAIAASGGLFVLICHAFVTGVDDERVAALEAVMRAAVEDDRVAVRTAGEVASELVRPR